MKTSQDIINDSGYPLQIHLENLIKSTENKHNWSVLAKEHRWVKAESQDEGFIDLILQHDQYQVRLVIECKRVTGSWTFLIPTINPVPTRQARLLQSHYNSFSFTWADLPIEPESYESAFCVMEVEGKKDSRTLEKLSGEVLLSLEYLALEEMDLRRLSQGVRKMYYLPVIVTTAKLQKCLFDPNSINIDDGKITTSTIDEIEFIRFRKNLAASLEYDRPDITNLRESNRENDRTVFIIQAKSFVNFLMWVIGR